MRCACWSHMQSQYKDSGFHAYRVSEKIHQAESHCKIKGISFDLGLGTILMIYVVCISPLTTKISLDFHSSEAICKVFVLLEYFQSLLEINAPKVPHNDSEPAVDFSFRYLPSPGQTTSSHPVARSTTDWLPTRSIVSSDWSWRYVFQQYLIWFRHGGPVKIFSMAFSSIAFRRLKLIFFQCVK